MFGLGPLELGIILAIVVVLFGAKRLPEVGSGIGKAIKNFKSGIAEASDSPGSSETAKPVTTGADVDTIDVSAKKQQVTETNRDS